MTHHRDTDAPSKREPKRLAGPREHRENKQRAAAEKILMDWQDPHRKAMTRRENEAMRDFRRDGHARREFGQEWGQEDHRRWMEERCRAETARGRVEKRDFDVDARMRHPDSNQVQLDYVDYRTDTIVDRKPLAKGETTEELKSRYADQRRRHIEAYEFNTGRKVFAYEYDLSPSSSDLGKEEMES